MKCIKTDKLAAYVDGVLGQEEKIKIDKHLEFCPSCRDVVAALEREDHFLEQAINSPVLPVGFDEEVLSKLAPYPAKKKRWNWTYQLITAASIVLAFGVGAAFYGGAQPNTGGNDIQTPVEEMKDTRYVDGVQILVHHVSASPLKIEVFYEVIPDEELLEEYLRKNNVVHLSQVEKDHWPLPRGKITDDKGVELPFREISKGEGQSSFVIKPAEIDILPDNIHVEIHFDEFFMRDGDWKVNIPVDLTEAKANAAKHPIQETLEYDNFRTEVLEWETSQNAYRLTLQADYSRAENERLQTIVKGRGNESDVYPIIEPELFVVTEDGKKLKVDGRTLHSNMGQAFTMEFEFANRVEGMPADEYLKAGEELSLQIEGFRLQEPDNTQFELTDQSANVKLNDWTIESVTSEPGNGSTKVVTISGKTNIQNIESMTSEITTDKEWVTPETIYTSIESDGTFTIQTTLPDSSTKYHLDIQSITKWQGSDGTVLKLPR
ncbi:anti-sigma factor family protein [Sutcliffiella deserti]|uniref:anti-sigma factor family protein n=1 Tax=Sutcliffiella deserti TaxID=2875501 RepID=UPI001CBFC082|nr:zf-HC2 domain-containing protein [Sutcliffiella deserti]